MCELYYNLYLKPVSVIIYVKAECYEIISTSYENHCYFMKSCTVWRRKFILNHKYSAPLQLIPKYVIIIIQA
jgi:hypothetical protein